VADFLLGMLAGFLLFVSFVACLGAYMYYFKPRKVIRMTANMMMQGASQRPRKDQDAV
jgi:hypothetical protein